LENVAHENPTKKEMAEKLASTNARIPKVRG
jgi:hypothetical protein